MNRVLQMLKLSAEADKSKALLSLELLIQNGVGIGDHSTDDFYRNAEDALKSLADAEDRLEMLERHFNVNIHSSKEIKSHLITKQLNG